VNCFDVKLGIDLHAIWTEQVMFFATHNANISGGFHE